MTSATLSTRLRAVGVVGVLSLALLSGCGGGGDDDAEKEPESDGTSAPSSEGSDAAEPYLPVGDDIELTEPGSDLDVGQPAVVAWGPRQDEVAVLGINVKRIEKTSFKESFEGWDVTKLANTTPYFVRASVSNPGPTDLGAQTLPLYALDDSETLNEATNFTEPFTPCPSGPLPAKFPAGARAEVCMVYLLPTGVEITGVSFRLGQDLDLDPVTWTGPIEKVQKPDDTKKKNKKGGPNQPAPNAPQ